MTAAYGWVVEKTDDSKTCQRCSHYITLIEYGQGVMGCTNKASDHYGHVLLPFHPECEEARRASLRRKGNELNL